jgi:hypothetical protein
MLYLLIAEELIGHHILNDARQSEINTLRMAPASSNSIGLSNTVFRATDHSHGFPP